MKQYKLDILKKIEEASEGDRMMETPYDSIFCSLTFIDKELQFEDCFG